MNLTYKILSALLAYPDQKLQDGAVEAAVLLAKDPALDAGLRVRLAVFAESLGRADLLEAQAAYVDLFDRGRALSLHLFEHVHGESRDRGQAMVSLRERYRAAGLDIAANELPDYLPLFLEFLAVLPPTEAQAMLAETAHIVCVLGERLEKRQSPYTLLFQALGQLAAAKADPVGLAALRDVPCDNPDDLAALDRSWEEAEVRFGPGDAASDGCPRASDMLARMRVDGDATVGEKA